MVLEVFVSCYFKLSIPEEGTERQAVVARGVDIRAGNAG
jgi:hypothetical protein